MNIFAKAYMGLLYGNKRELKEGLERKGVNRVPNNKRYVKK